LVLETMNELPSMFATHSLRRGGAQYLHHELGWSTEKLAAWGGWTHEQSTSMIRYLIGESVVNYDVMHRYK
jgi:hypothetical protein